jgi:hypothetical protein
MNNSILAIVFLIASTLLTTTAITTMVPAAYADNKVKAEDDSIAQQIDCDENEVNGDTPDFASGFCANLVQISPP